MQVWKKYSSRGRSAFPNVQSVDTPDPLTAVWNLSRPTPYLLSALNARDWQVLPRHLYAGTDILNNPANIAPIGTGPFRLKEWVRGNYLTLERNPAYWQTGKPLLDQVIYRFMSDPSSVSAALETGSVHVAYADTLSNSEIRRLKNSPALSVIDRLNTYGGTGIMALEFNLQRPQFQDVRVRQAFAHAIDKDFILKHILLDQGTIADSPIPKNFPQFYSAGVPQYPFDLKRAAALLDEAGLKPDKDGIRLRIKTTRVLHRCTSRPRISCAAVLAKSASSWRFAIRTMRNLSTVFTAVTTSTPTCPRPPPPRTRPSACNGFTGRAISSRGSRTPTQHIIRARR